MNSKRKPRRSGRRRVKSLHVGKEWFRQRK